MTGVAAARVAGMSRRLAIGAGLASAVVAAGVALRFAALPETMSGWLTPLLATAFLLAGLLVRRVAPGLAWPSLVVAAMLGTAVPVGNARSIVDAERAFGEWLLAAGAVLATAIPTALVAALYATRPERRPGRWVTPAVMLLSGWLIIAAVLLPVLVGLGTRADPAITWSDIALLPITSYVQLVLLLLGIGVTGDVLPALARADARLAAAGTRPGWPTRIRATVEELTPGLAALQERDVEAERRRVAGDLHAAVLPALRRAISEAEQGAGPDLLAERLRGVDLELQRMLGDLWPVVLDSFGIVEALEELAEAAESEVTVVELEVVDVAGRPPAAVERAAFRVAQLALDNAVRHAAAGGVRIVVDVAPDRLELSVADDGRGLDSEQLEIAARAGSRGLVDARRRAAAVGADLEVSSGAGGGTLIRFRWPGDGPG